MATSLISGTSNREAVATIHGLQHIFSGAEDSEPVLSNIDMTLMPGEITIMTGPSGSGKTTLLTLIGALRSAQKGKIQVLGKDLQGMDHKNLVQVRRQIGFIFQAHNLIDALTARQNVRIALELDDYSAAEMDAMVTEILTRLGLGHRLDYQPEQLSGGQRQRVAIARALVNRPRLVLADEPTAALDEEAGNVVVSSLKKLAVNEQAAILIVTHDKRILGYADRIVNMIDGRIVSDFLVNESLRICRFLRNCPVFEQLTPTELTEISEKMGREAHRQGAILIRHGDKADKLYIIRSGSVDVLRERSGTVERLVTLKAGEFFGEAAIISGKPRNATVVAKEDIELYTLDKEAFQAAMDASANFEQQVRDILFQRS